MHKRFRKTFTYQGKRYEVGADTQEGLYAALAARKHELEVGVVDSGTLVIDWIRRYVDVYKRPHVSEKTLSDIESYFRLYVTPEIGYMRIGAVKPVHCQAVMNSMIGKSGSYIKKVHFYMSAMFESAINDGLILTNPAKRVTRPSGRDGRRRAITAHEREILLRACETSPYGLWALFMLYTGAMPSETARVQWQHIDMENRRVFIDGTKTSYRKRWVPMVEALHERFAECRREPFGYVFTNEAGRPLTDANLRRRWNMIRREMNLLMGCRTDYGKTKRLVPPYPLAADFTAYCLRHTYATDLRDAGVDITVAMHYMGHSSTKMLEQVYVHQTDYAFNDSRAKIEAFHASDVEKDHTRQAASVDIPNICN
jgi:integrase